MNPNTLSQRGATAATSPLRADFELLAQALENEYHPTSNPDGAIPLCIAENLLGWESLRDKLANIARTKTCPDWVASYTDTLGHPDFRSALANFLSIKLGGDSLQSENLAISAGATAVIELTSFLLADAEDHAVIPGPAYGGYTPDIQFKAGLRRYDLHLKSGDGHPGECCLTTADLDRVYAELGDRFKILILTQPNNPTGQIFTEDNIFETVTWCEERKIHCVVNEIYALSLIDQNHPDLLGDYEDRQWFVSCLPQLEARKSDYFHWWYSFSKDFGISGLRVGALYSKNESLIKAYGNYGAPITSSNYTQWLLTELLGDHAWIDNWMKNERKLTDSYVLVIRALRELNIPYTPAIGSLFAWFDLRKYLTADTDEAWVNLWRSIYDESGLLLTHPLGMGAPDRGWFRMVFTGVPGATLKVAMKRFRQYCSK